MQYFCIKKNMQKTMTMLLCAMTMGASAQTIEGYGEVDIDHGAHLLVGIEKEWANGWTMGGEAEYNGTIDLTQLFVQKTFGEWASVRVGKITMPIGMANIYDRPTKHFTVSLPLEECYVLPEETNRIGMAMAGERRGWAYEVQVLVRDRQMAVVGRVERQATDELHLGMSGYCDGQVVVSADAEYQTDKFVARGIATYSEESNAAHMGIEAGYDILHGRGGQLGAFCRYDCLIADSSTHRLTVGINYRPVPFVSIKAEYTRGSESQCGWGIGIGVTL